MKNPEPQPAEILRLEKYWNFRYDNIEIIVSNAEKPVLTGKF